MRCVMGGVDVQNIHLPAGVCVAARRVGCSCICSLSTALHSQLRGGGAVRLQLDVGRSGRLPVMQCSRRLYVALRTAHSAVMLPSR